MKLTIRDALPDDAAAGCEVLRRSIVELCVADHENDPAILDKWLSNKTVAAFQAWIAQRDNSLLIAYENDCVLAVGAVTDAGQITLNYVSPDVRFRGISKALLAALEERAIKRGCSFCTLNSTETARRFYLSNGYEDIGAPADHSGMNAGYPMSKALNLNVDS